MSNESPVDLEILKLLNADLTGECTIRLVEDVLGSDADVVVGDLAGERQVGSGGRDDDLGVGVELGRVEVVDDGGDAVGNTVPILCQYNPVKWCVMYYSYAVNVGDGGVAGQMYILKLPPMKNWRGMMGRE